MNIKKKKKTYLIIKYFDIEINLKIYYSILLLITF